MRLCVIMQRGTLTLSATLGGLSWDPGKLCLSPDLRMSNLSYAKRRRKSSRGAGGTVEYTCDGRKAEVARTQPRDESELITK